MELYISGCKSWVSYLTSLSPQILTYKMGIIHTPQSCCKIEITGASLVAQWLRIRLPMQGTQVRSLIREDPTCCGATKPVCHNYWACALEPASHNYWACVLQLLKPVRLEPMLHNKRSHHSKKLLTATKSSPCSLQLGKARVQQWRPNTAKNK